LDSLLLPVHDAETVSIELSKLNWELIDLTYRFEWDDPNWISGKNGDELSKRKEAVDNWSKKREQYLASISRRVKYEGLMGRVVAKDHLGRVPFKIVYDMEPVAGLDVNYRVSSTSPGGEVRVNEDTVLNLQESSTSW
jgi:hypothetical protein